MLSLNRASPIKSQCFLPWVLESIPIREVSPATLLLIAFIGATPPTPSEFYFYLWNSLPASAWKTGWTLRTGVRSGLWEVAQTDSYCQHKAVIFINFNLRLYTVSDSLSTPLWKEGEKASQKDEFQNRKITLIMKPSQLKKELLKVAKWKMSRFWGYMHKY